MAKKRSRTYDTSRPLLDVYLYNKHIGTIGQHGSDVWFKYDSWILDDATPERWRLSVRLPVTEETYGHEETLVFFDNLLLESDTREALAALTKNDPSDLPGLLGKVGGECAGAVAIWPVGTAPPVPDSYRTVRQDELEDLFSAQHAARLTQAQIESRQSMSGVQHKLVLRRTGQGYDLPLNGAPGTHILKRTTGRYDGLAVNEWVCLGVFKALGLQTANADVIGGADGLLAVERYDRTPHDGWIQRFHQEDFCQATGRRIAAKYQHTNGPAFADLAATLRSYSVNPTEDLTSLLRAAVANILLGNMDAHAKNFSLLTAQEGIRLAPFYDIVSTEVYPALSPTMSMRFGHSYDPRTVSEADLVRFARDLKVNVQLVRETAAEVTDAVGVLHLEVLNRAASLYGHAPVLDRIKQLVAKRVATFSNALTRHPLIQIPDEEPPSLAS